MRKFVIFVGHCAARLRALILCLALTAAGPTIAAETHVHGQVTLHNTGAPVVGATLEITSGLNGWVAQVTTDSSGNFEWSGDCPDIGGANCYVQIGKEPTSATPHDATLQAFPNGASNAVVDLQPHALALLAGTVGNPPPGLRPLDLVLALRRNPDSGNWEDAGSLVREGAVNESDPSQFGWRVPEGTYRLCMGSLRQQRLRQCFDHQAEAPIVSQQTFTDIVLGEGAQRTDIAFDLELGGTLEGTVVDTYKNAPLVVSPYATYESGLRDCMFVTLFDAEGVQFDFDNLCLDADGHYAVSGTPAGLFTVRYQLSDLMFRDATQFYPNASCFVLPCPGAVPLATVDHGSITVDLPLHPSVVIRGTVRDAATQTPLAGVNVASWFSTPNDFSVGPLIYHASWTQTDTQGNYAVYATAPIGSSGAGVYVAAQDAAHVASIFPDTSCLSGLETLCGGASYLFSDAGIPAGAARVADGSRIGDVVDGIDFALRRGGTFSGALATSDIPAITIYDGNGIPVASFDVFATPGTYQAPTLPPGLYYASAEAAHGSGIVCEVFAGRPCPPASGYVLDVAPTPITIVGGQDTGNVNFSLRDPIFANDFDG